MRKLLTVLFLIFIVTNIYSQNGWIRQDSLYEFPRIFGMDFVNENTGYVTGLKGFIFKTTNGGQNWVKVNITDTSHFRYVFVLDNNTVFLSDYSKYIFKSTNSGMSWTALYATSDDINSIFMCNANTGYVIAQHASIPFTNVVLKTTDAGLNWTTLLSAPYIQNYVDIFCVSPDTAFITGSQAIRKTVNGGSSWTTYYLNSAHFQPIFFTITFVNNNTGFTAGQYLPLPVTDNFPMIFRTTNCGLNWTGKLFPTITNAEINRISFYDELNGCAVGDSSIVLRTTNSGLTWIRQKRLSQDLYSVSFRGNNKISIGGLRGVIYVTTNGGWDTTAVPTLLYPPNNSQCIVQNPVMDWKDNLYNAAVYRLQIANDSNFASIILNVNNIDTSGYAVPTNILTASHTYFWRVNAGNPAYTSPWSSAWKFNTNAPPAPVLISPLNNDTGVISTPVIKWDSSYSASSYQAQISSDSNFSQLNVDTNTTSLQFNVPYNKLSWFTTHFWRVRGYNANGAGSWSLKWKFKTTKNRPNLLVPLNNDTGILYNALFDWDNYPNASSYKIQLSSDSLFGNINFNTTTYTSQYLLHTGLTPNSFYYWRVNANTPSHTSFWSEKRRFKTSGLYSGIEKQNEIPKEYNISNYPNPFNQSTVFIVQCPMAGKVTVKVFDINGKEVAVLVNEYLQVGTYEVSFDSRLNRSSKDLPSGIYFYRMEVNDFTKTNKFVLLK